MERSSRDERNRPWLSSHHDNEPDEDDYAVPEEDYDDGMVHIQPARHCLPNTEYADRGHHRPIPSAEGRNKFNNHPSPPKRVIPGPAVNRDLKPGRQTKNKTEKTDGPSKTNVSDLHQRRRSPPRPAKPVPVARTREVTSPSSRLPSTGSYPTDPSTQSHTAPAWKELPKPAPLIPGRGLPATGIRLPTAGEDIPALRRPTVSIPSHGGYEADTKTSQSAPALGPRPYVSPPSHGGYTADTQTSPGAPALGLRPYLSPLSHGGYTADTQTSHCEPALGPRPYVPPPSHGGNEADTKTSQIAPALGPRPYVSPPSHGGYTADIQTSHSGPTWKEFPRHQRQPTANSKCMMLSSGERASKPPQRLSLDLESQELFDSRQMPRKEGLTDNNSVKRHHEWPQDKEDLDHSNFKPQERPAVMSDWYVGDFSRVEAEHALHLVNRDGAFLVRDCSKCTSEEPLVLALFFEKRVYNLQIRYSLGTSKYTLGTGLRTHDTFDTVPDIIKFHSIFPIVLIDGRNPADDSPRRACVLMHPITRMDIQQLLQTESNQLLQTPKHISGFEAR
ncbi:B-cell linker protein-like [Engraulis encrasicolus]|uniref:B-cell linker protein-like n=1 Tax=Engraulis encrasicolus TaxID=184585 RepID=UPI002FD42B89